MDYFTKIETKPTPDLTWNIPEQAQGTVNIIGGNSQNFRTIVKISEYLGTSYPIKTINTVLPDVLQSKLPNLPNFVFLSSTDSGSFANGEELARTINSANFNLLLGDLSKNSITAKAIASACEHAKAPLLITRDSVDLIAESSTTERILMNENLILFASMPGLIKLFRAVYYPKMLLLSQSLVQVADALHKFTLSYPTSIITLHNEQILIARNGEVKSVPLASSGYQPMTFYSGELAAKTLALNLYNPHNFLDATIAAIFKSIK